MDLSLKIFHNVESVTEIDKNTKETVIGGLQKGERRGPDTDRGVGQSPDGLAGVGGSCCIAWLTQYPLYA
mgnify:CR=1 FL=1